MVKQNKHNYDYFSCFVLLLNVMLMCLSQDTENALGGDPMSTCPDVTEGRNKARVRSRWSKGYTVMKLELRVQV